MGRENYQICSLVLNAQEIGANRTPINHDVFVHIDFGYDNEPVYLERIKQAYKTSENPILLHFDDSNFSKFNGVETIRHKKGATGYLNNSNLGLFFEKTKGLHQGDSFRIHGAAFGMCPTNFIIGLAGAINFGVNMFDLYMDETKKRVISDLEYELNYGGVLLDSNFRLGIMNDSGNALAVISDYFDRYGENIPFFKSTSIVTDGNTKLFSKTKLNKKFIKFLN